MAIYGFKANDSESQVAIGALLARADSVENSSFDTLAQYVVSNVELKPTSLSFDKPKQWGLVVNTTFDGLNDESNQAIYFNTNYKDVGDGYLVYTLSAEEFSDMILGGLYNNPEGFISKLKDELIGKKFYRSTSVNLLKVVVLDDSLSISAGDLSAKETAGQVYYVGQDLRSYDVLTKDANSDFVSQLQSLLSKFKDSPVIASSRDLGYSFDNDIEPVSDVSVQVDPLSDVAVRSEVDYGIDYDNLNQSIQPQTRSAIDLAFDNISDTGLSSDNLDLPVLENDDQSMVDNVNDTLDLSLDELMSQLNDQGSNNASRKKKNTRQYVDDFADALAESQESSSKLKKKRKQTSQAVANQQKQKSIDVGLDL